MRHTLAAGLHERLITQAVEEALARLAAAGRKVERKAQQLDWLDEALARHVTGLLRAALAGLPAEGGIDARVDLVRRVLETLPAEVVDLAADTPAATRDALLWVAPENPGLATPVPPPRPEHGLVHPALLFNGAQDVSLFHELEREIASADRVDAIVAFLKFSGFKLLEQALRRFVERGGELRLVASTYVGATDARAVKELCRLGARVRLAYEEDGTRLHAKAWLFHRASGLSTAYIGSSNLSRSALTDGAEWNVRVTEVATPALLERFDQAFTQFWEALGPEDHHPEAHAERLQRSLSRARGESGALDQAFLVIDASPKRHQERVLDALEAERAHGHAHNLVVAATGTGKTWVSAFDYRRLRAEGTVDSLLFVAHRKEILEQALLVFRTVLKDPGFGELLVDGARPERGRHVFASIQSLGADAVAALDAAAFDMVVVDEFHHAAAPTYDALLQRLAPTILLGLTATPERADGRSVLHWFDHRIAAEIRLWDALEEGLLAPFHYFGVHDPGSAAVAWRRGRLDVGELDRLYTGDHLRARQVLQAVERHVADPRRMRALGFCVGVGHAELMARVSREHGLAAVALHGGTPREDRRAAIRDLRSGALQLVFTVDLFNEGVDLPEVDTVLFLRPTESATVFLQQLGRGLRRHPGKSQLVVLDLVGQVHQDYRYEVRYRALLGGTRKQVRDQVERGFPRLPPGCAIQLEEQAERLVLDGIQKVVGSAGWRLLVHDLQRLGPRTGLADLLRHTDADLDDVFQPQTGTGRSWSLLRRDAGFERRESTAEDLALRKRVGRLRHVDDEPRLTTWRRWLMASNAPRVDRLTPRDLALARMLWVSVGDRRRPLVELQEELDAFWSHDVAREELAELLGVLRDRVRHTPRDLGDPALPMCSHATYTRAELVAAFGATAKGRLRESREGPVWVEEAATDAFFVTLDKSDDAFTPSIRYADYPISPTRFHWESQNHTHDGTPVGRRYVEHDARGSRVLLLVRERPKDERGETLPFTCLGWAHYERHGGARPMQIVWTLERPVPAWVMSKGRAVA
ncbi:MAG: DUF3427 domain-containing protein [Alphaproteobacteria bacterium]|nr:DUF3427 domain-containing protein [Alphaproteobacteria bacterium]